MKQDELGKVRQERVYALLDRLGIEYGKIEHPPIFTQADSELRPIQIDAVSGVEYRFLALERGEPVRQYVCSGLARQANRGHSAASFARG